MLSEISQMHRNTKENSGFQSWGMGQWSCGYRVSVWNNEKFWGKRVVLPAQQYEGT